MAELACRCFLNRNRSFSSLGGRAGTAGPGPQTPDFGARARRTQMSQGPRPVPVSTGGLRHTLGGARLCPSGTRRSPICQEGSARARRLALGSGAGAGVCLISGRPTEPHKHPPRLHGTKVVLRRLVPTVARDGARACCGRSGAEARRCRRNEAAAPTGRAWTQQRPWLLCAWE